MKKLIAACLLATCSFASMASDTFQFKGVVVSVDVSDWRLTSHEVSSEAVVYFARTGYVINQQTPVPSCLKNMPARVFAVARAYGDIIGKAISLESQLGKRNNRYPFIFTATANCNQDVPIRITAVETDEREREAILEEFDRVPLR